MSDIREKIAEHIFNVIMSCSDATVEEAEKMAYNETMPILSIVREAVNGLHYVCEEDRHIDGSCNCMDKNEALDDVVKLLS